MKSEANKEVLKETNSFVTDKGKVVSSKLFRFSGTFKEKPYDTQSVEITVKSVDQDGVVRSKIITRPDGSTYTKPQISSVFVPIEAIDALVAQLDVIRRSK